MKRLVEFIAMLLYLLLAGVIFMSFSSVRYAPQGTIGQPDALWTILSAVYIFTLPVLFWILGRKHCIGAYLVFVVVFLHFIAAGMLGYLGYAHSFKEFIYPFFVTIAPLAPLCESLIQTFALAETGIYVMLLVPMFVFCLSVLSYLVAHTLANRAAVSRNYESMRRSADDIAEE